MVGHLHNLQSDLPEKSSTHMVPYVVITVLLAMFPVLYKNFFFNTNEDLLLKRIQNLLMILLLLNYAYLSSLALICTQRY